MLNIIIIVLILTGLTFHRYLTTFWEQGLLPYPFGFTTFANLFALIYLVSIIWMFGAVAGIIISIMCYFQIVYSAVLWLFLLPFLLSMYGTRPKLTIPQVNPFIYGGFSFIVVILGALTIVNFFNSEYKSILEQVNLWTFGLSLIVILLVGNVARIVIMSKLVRE